MLDKFYVLETPVGVRTVKCMEIINGNKIYGGFSVSDYVEEGDIQFMIIPENSNEATLEEINKWVAWYSL
jgi:hypothetical protein